MTKYRIAVLPGDGIGKEVIEAAMIVLKKLRLEAEYLYGDIGWEFWCREGNALPERTIKLLRETDACLFGAITSKPKEDATKELAPELQGKGLSYISPIVKLRQLFDLYINLRPCKAYPGNPLNYRENIDLVIFRENTEGSYAGVEFYPLPDKVREALMLHPKMKDFQEVPADQIAVSTRIMTARGCERIVKAAFEYARQNHRKSVTLVEKPNVLRETGGLMLKMARKIAAQYPDIKFFEANVDAMCMWLVKNPQDYEVLVAENLFGDIISDLSAQLVGGLGFACAGNIGDNYAVFEPTHGSAPKYTGMYKVNPIATLLAAKMMLEWLGEKDKANTLEQAVAEVIREGKARTYDLGGTAKTLEVAEAVASKI
ncbi:MAG: isocitrate/isopropylmalate dehydrogenase family protein [Acidobacteriota bacterium]|nr:isocitrate/isopropylmalate dehydrogenase family protein [Acidobacteriota bacterium]MDW3228867.1 isocitrate/isopropylmalate dehydrogenase family protein [Acidobacteriota bacterium]MDY0231056.1 isocitrate/isopropylmalate dehydrogenase family protein [Candidatus Saccharicenans sp.]